MKNKTLKGLLLIGIGVGVGLGVYVTKKNKGEKYSTKDLKKEKIVDKNNLKREDVNYIDLSSTTMIMNEDYNNINNNKDDIVENVIETKENNPLDFENYLSNKDENNIKFFKEYENNENDKLIKDDFPKNYNEDEMNDSKTLEFNEEYIEKFDIAKITNESKDSDDVEEDIGSNEINALEQNDLEDISTTNYVEKECDVEDDIIKEETNNVDVIENNTLEIKTKNDNIFDEIIDKESGVIDDKIDNDVNNDLIEETLNDVDLSNVLKEDCNTKEDEVKIDCIDEFEDKEKENLPNIGLLDYYMICKEFWVKDYKPSDLMLILESLYNKELITNPKSECRYVSNNIASNFDIILENLYTIDELKNYVEKITTNDIERIMEDKNYVDDLWVKDRRNEAIVPTSKVPNFNEMTKDEKDVYLFIAKTFISIFLDNEEYVETKNNKIIGNECFVTNEDIDEIENKLIESEEKPLENKETNEDKKNVVDEKTIIEEELKNISERKVILENNKKQGFLSTRDFIELSQELSSREQELLNKLNKLN